MERERYIKKINSGLINSIWLQYGTDINLLEKEVKFIKKNSTKKQMQLFGSLLIPSKQFIARFKFRPWRGVYISENYLCSLDNYYAFTKDLLSFYLENKIIPIIESESCSSEKLNAIYKLL